MESKCYVNVTYCWNRVNYTILSSLSDMGLKVVVGDTSKYNTCSLSKKSFDAFTYSDPITDPDVFINDLIKAVENMNQRFLYLLMTKVF